MAEPVEIRSVRNLADALPLMPHENEFRMSGLEKYQEGEKVRSEPRTVGNFRYSGHLHVSTAVSGVINYHDFLRSQVRSQSYFTVRISP